MNDERRETDDAWRYVPPQPRETPGVSPVARPSGGASTEPATLPGVAASDASSSQRWVTPGGEDASTMSPPAPVPFDRTGVPGGPVTSTHVVDDPSPLGVPTGVATHPYPATVQPSPANSAPAWAFGEPPPLAYHRMARIDWHVAQWWRPFATLGVGLGLVVLALIGWGIIGLVWEPLGLPSPSEELEDGRNPADLFFMLGSLATFVPVVVLASWWGAGRRGSIHSVIGRVRWCLMGRAARVVVPVYAVIVLAPPLIFGRSELTFPPLTASLVAAYVVIVLLTPLQCAGEEYLFRGLPQQALGTWLKSPLWGIVLPAPLFVLGHGYDWVGQIDIACFALSSGALVWRSGGLELPILVHAANNTMSFLLAPLSSDSLEQGAVDPGVLIFSLPLTFGITAWLWWWVGTQYDLDWKTPVRRLPGPQREKVGRWL